MDVAALPTERADGLPGRVYLETFGCQMNELDSELVRGQLGALGYQFTDDPSHAQILLYNTCSVREQAENKVWSRLGIVGRRKRAGEQFIVGVIGCMAEREGPDLIRRFPQVDIMCGPGELDKLPMLLDNVCKTRAVELADRVALQGNNNRRSATLSAAADNLELLDLSRAFDPDRAAGTAAGRSAYVRITRGCNKFCTYCVVPYTRGAEVHRPPQAIIDECRRLADAGVIEITLLGQTVNHYVYTHGAAVSTNGAELPQIGPGANAFTSARPRHRHATAIGRTTTFADLLHRIHDEVPDVQRLRFVTSFPRDFGDDILQVMADSPRICRYLHVPAQSGSNRILKLMNRGYTVEQYLEFIDRARAFLPDVCIAGDIIVGFPTETEEDFSLTRDLLIRARYKNCFIFKYSPRPGTIAIDRFEDDVAPDAKRRRNNDLLALQAQISAEVHARYIGRTVDVFVEHISGRGNSSPRQPSPSNGALELTINGQPNALAASPQARDSNPAAAGRDASLIQLSGRTAGDLIAVFDLPAHRSPDEFLGRIVPLRISSAAPLLLRGELARESAVSTARSRALAHA